mmetsp:Transcript_36658/g.91892  ORF Transcript_36658/g.91892 Transcript_36658/m.91892 type:complete len:162 (-) Transcript_36658:29-514(-)
MVEKGESFLEGAERELREETGYTEGEFVELGVAYPLPGLSTLSFHYILATGLKRTGTRSTPPSSSELFIFSLFPSSVPVWHSPILLFVLCCPLCLSFVSSLTFSVSSRVVTPECEPSEVIQAREFELSELRSVIAGGADVDAALLTALYYYDLYQSRKDEK